MSETPFTQRGSFIEKNGITYLDWSPSGRFLAIVNNKNHISIINMNDAQEIIEIFDSANQSIVCISWSSDERYLSFIVEEGPVVIWDISENRKIKHFDREFDSKERIVESGYLWDEDADDAIYTTRTATDTIYYDYTALDFPNAIAVNSPTIANKKFIIKTHNPLQLLEGHTATINTLCYSPQSATLASASGDCRIGIWQVDNDDSRFLEGHSKSVSSLAWNRAGSVLASGSADRTIRIWDGENWLQKNILEGHTGNIVRLQFSADNLLLMSQSADNSIRFWRCDTWETIHSLKGLPFDEKARIECFALHPKLSLFAVASQEQISIWEIDLSRLFQSSSQFTEENIRYTNAKIVLVGDSGVGKSGLGLVLSRQSFEPTESTHGRRIWEFDKSIGIKDGKLESRETLLWDLAGQPGYRLIHQLHLSEIALALIVFDSRSEIDPFSGVRYWNRALTQTKVERSSHRNFAKFLVSARMDRGSIGVSEKRIEHVLKELQLDGYFKTSAKEGWGIQQLIDAIKSSIKWENLPQISSTKLFQSIKTFFIEEKSKGNIVFSVNELFNNFIASDYAPTNVQEDIYAEFETVLGRVEASGLIKKLNFGNLVLLQPEILDAYASAIVNAAKDEPDGMGSLFEEDIKNARFRMSSDERIRDVALEKILLIATIENLLYHEIVLRENSEDGPILVFPSEFTREHPTLPEPEGKALVLIFEGAIVNIYTTLTVRLSHSGIFHRLDMWKNASTYRCAGGVGGIHLRRVEEGKGELVIFFDDKISGEQQQQFEDYVEAHLRKKCLPETIERRRIFKCEECNTSVPEEIFLKRTARGHTSLKCSVCEMEVSLVENIQLQSSKIREIRTQIDKRANTKRDLDTAKTILEGKMTIKDFDVFLAHNHKDKLQIERISEILKLKGLNPWLDKEQIPPGRWFQDVIQQAIPTVKSAAIFIGPSGLGKWQILELRSFISQCVDADIPVIPALLPGVENIPEEFLFLKELNWVKFSSDVSDEETINTLIWGITGRKPA